MELPSTCFPLTLTFFYLIGLSSGSPSVLLVTTAQTDKNTMTETIRRGGVGAAAVVDLQTFLNSSLDLGRGSEELFVHIKLEHIKEMYTAIKKVNTFPQPSNRLRLMISYYSMSEKDKDLDMTRISLQDQPQFKKLLLRSTFYPSNPLLVQIFNNGIQNQSCFIAYRLDIIHDRVVLKDVTANEDVCGATQTHDVAHRLRSASTLTNDMQDMKLVITFVESEHVRYDSDVGWEDVHDGNGTTTAQFVLRGGYAVELIWALQKVLNFSISTHESQDWGFYNSTTGEWSGSVGDVLNGKVDLSVSSAAITSERASVVNFNFGTHKIAIAIFFRKVVTHSGANFDHSLLAPFQCNLWVTICGWIILNATTYLILLAPIMGAKCDSQELLTFVGNLISLSLNPLCLRGSHWIPSSFWIRVLYGFQLLAGLVLYTSYAGILISFLSAEKVAINNLTELASGKYGFQFGLDDFPLTRHMIETYRSDGLEAAQVLKIFEKSKVPGTNDLIKYDKLWDRIMTGQLAYLFDDITAFQALPELENWSMDDACNIQDLQIPSTRKVQGTFVKMGSQLKKVIDYGIIKLMETGHVRLFRSRHLPARPRCHKINRFKGVSVADMKVALNLLVCSALLSFVVLLLEFSCSYLLARKRARSTL